MAPIKFEEQLKDKLEKRTLSPSSESWAKLSQRLDAEDKKSKNPLFWWLGIAAGVIIMIAVSVQFFKTGEVEKVMPKVVEEPIQNNKINDQQLKIEKQQQNEIKSLELVNDTNDEENKVEEIQSTDKSQIIEYKKSTYKAPKAKTRVANNNTIKNKALTPSNNESINKETPISNSETIIKDAVADALNKLKSEKTTVTDREVDSLLKLASKELFKDKLQKETIKTVDAAALLMSVEDEMGQSFRSRVFEALKDSYETVKTAVAERNN